MRIDPQYIQGLVSAANQNSANQQKYSTEIATGVSVNSLSDNPSAASQDFLLRSEISSNDNFVQTASGVTGALQVTDTALGSVVSQITQAISLATEGNNGTLNASDLSSIANQLTGVRSEILSLANTSYQGQFVFAGSQTSTQPFSLDTSTTPATVVYSGDSLQTTIQSPSGQSFPLNVPGNQIFGSGSTGILSTLNNLIASFSAGNADIADTTALNTDLQGISQQRVIIDNSISGLAVRQHLHAKSDHAIAGGARQSDPGRYCPGRHPTQHVGDAGNGVARYHRGPRAAADAYLRF